MGAAGRGTRGEREMSKMLHEAEPWPEERIRDTFCTPPHRAPPPGLPRLLTWPRPGPQILPPTLQTSPHPRKRQNSSAGNMDEENEMACAAPGLVSSQNASGPPAPPQPCPDPDCISAGTVLLLSRVTMLSLTLFPLATITIVTKAAIHPTRRQINIVLGNPLIGGRC